MVGDPKNLSDLRKIDAAVKLTCDGCGRVEVRELADLVAEIGEHGGTTSWPEFANFLMCPNQKCMAKRPRPLVTPFTNGAKRPPPSGDTILLNLALKVLRGAANRSVTQAVGTLEVRLALRVLHRHLGDSGLLKEYWKAATALPRHPWSSCHQPYRWITERLVSKGVQVWVENRP